jgi:hypothetical protein
MKKTFLLLSLSLALSLSSWAQHFLPGNPALDSTIVSYIDKVNADSIQSYMQSLEDFGTRFCLANNRREVASWIKNKFISFGYEDSRLDSFQLSVQYPWGSGNWYTTWQYNIVSTYEGYMYPDQVYVLGAHHDAIVSSSSNPFVIAPGADDNASGVAGALEIARIMKTYGYVPQSTIKFITFAAEELGLHGAWDYANKASAAGMDIKLMLNNDMISYCTLPESQWAIQIQKYQNSQWATNLAKYIINNFTILNVVESTQYIQQSDSWAFYSNGYSAIFFIENQFTPYYHTINDLVSTTNKYYAAEVVKISLGMLIHQNGLGLPTSLSQKDGLIANFSNHPNPFSRQTTINYQLMEAGQVNVSVYDASGRVIDVITNGWQSPGTYNFNWDASAINAGIYFCRIQTPAQQLVIKIAKTN